MPEGCSLEGCCTFVNGRLAIYSMIMSVISYGLALAAVYGCKYVKLELNGGGEIGLGFFLIEDVRGGGCGEFPEFIEVDTMWNSARAVGSISTASGFLVLLGTIFLSCMSLSKDIIAVFGYLAFIGGILLLLTFIGYASDICDGLEFSEDVTVSKCKFGLNSGLAIAAGVFYIVTSFFIFGIPNPPDLEPEEEEEEEVEPPPPKPPPGTTETEITELEDGTRKTVKKTWKADGSMTIEETRKKPPRY